MELCGVDAFVVLYYVHSAGRSHLGAGERHLFSSPLELKELLSRFLKKEKLNCGGRSSSRHKMNFILTFREGGSGL